MDLKFDSVEVPKVERAKEPNPFDGVIGELAKELRSNPDSKAARKVQIPRKTDEDKTAADKLVRLLGKAGGAHGVTVRKTVHDDNGTRTVTFWVRERIAHSDAKPAVEAK